MMRTFSRWEIKYRLPVFWYYQVKNAFAPYMQPDKYTMLSSGRKYFVRSLYFDTYDYEAFHEKENGNYGRIKLRLRTYVQSSGPAAPIAAEIKTRKGSMVNKHSAFITYDEYKHFIEKGRWPHENSPILEEFGRLYHIRHLNPVTLVQYYREGYRSKMGDNVRITFDHDVSSCAGRELFPEKMFLRPHHPGKIILEIKFSGEKPVWCMNLVRKLGLTAAANSKYVQSVQAARYDVVVPAAVDYDGYTQDRIFKNTGLNKEFSGRFRGRDLGVLDSGKDL